MNVLTMLVHLGVRFLTQKPTNRRHQSKRIPSWMSKHPIFVPYCSTFTTTTGSLMTRFVHLQSLVPFETAKKLTKRELSRQTLARIGAKLWITLLLCVPVEIDILGHSCDVVKFGSLLKIALTHFVLSVLISSDSAICLQA